jgi:YegS/Rv2252/BmrU family lipid kinase
MCGGKPMKILFIVNPVAGKGKAKGLVPLIEGICEKRNVNYNIKFTTAPGEASQIAKKGAEEGFDRIVSVGGDGTLNEIVNGMVGTDAAIGVVPGGSGNDFIKTINLHRDVEQIIYDNIDGNAIKVDLARCNGRDFINIGSAGMDAKVAHETVKMKRIFSGKTAYIAAAIKTIFTYKGDRVLVDIDGKSFEQEATLLAVANGRYYGGGMLPAPDADIQDGLFDICVVKKFNPVQMLYLMPKYMKGKHGSIKGVRFYKGKRIIIESDNVLTVNLDGEIIMDKKIVFEILSEHVNVIVPQTNA